MVKIIGTQKLNDLYQWIYITITSNDKEYKYTDVAPIEIETNSLQAYVDAKESTYLQNIADYIANVPHPLPGEDPPTEPPEPREWTHEHPASIDPVFRMNQDVNAYIYAHYDAGTQASFLALASQSPEAEAATLPAWEWIKSVLAYYYARKESIIASSSPYIETWDFSQFDATDPNVSLSNFIS